MTPSQIYRLLLLPSWVEFKHQSSFSGTDVDHRDGFIHFSTLAQVRETANKHYKGHDALILVAVKTTSVEADLKWEVSRGGDLFPHLYTRLDLEAIDQDWRLPSDGQGGYVWPDFIY